MFEINFINHQGDIARKRRRLLIILFFILILAAAYFFFVRSRVKPDNTQKDVFQSISHAKNVILFDVSESDIKLLGVVFDKNKRWALVSSSKQNIVKIQPGDLVGNKAMRVKKITLNSVELFSERLGTKIIVGDA